MIRFECNTCGAICDAEKVPAFCADCGAENGSWTNQNTGSIEQAEPKISPTSRRKGSPPKATGGTGSPSSPKSTRKAVIPSPPTTPSIVPPWSPPIYPPPSVSKGGKSKLKQILIITIIIVFGYFLINIFNSRSIPNSSTTITSTNQFNSVFSKGNSGIFSKLSSLFKIRNKPVLYKSFEKTFYFRKAKNIRKVDIYSVPGSTESSVFCSITSGDSIQVYKLRSRDDNSFDSPGGLKYNINPDTSLIYSGYTSITSDEFLRIQKARLVKKPLSKSSKPVLNKTILFSSLPMSVKIIGRYIVFLTLDNGECYLQIFSPDDGRITYSMSASLINTGIPFVVSDNSVLLRTAENEIAYFPFTNGVLYQQNKCTLRIPKSSLLLDFSKNGFFMFYTSGILGGVIHLNRYLNGSIEKQCNISFSLNGNSLLYSNGLEFYAVSEKGKIKFGPDGTRFNYSDDDKNTGKFILNINNENGLYMQDSPFGLPERAAYNRNGSIVNVKVAGENDIYCFNKDNSAFLVTFTSDKQRSVLYSVRLVSGKSEVKKQLTMTGANLWNYSDGLLTGQMLKTLFIYSFSGI